MNRQQAIDRQDLEQALRTLKEGGIILYPTDTIWGLGCDATNPEAVAKIIELKGRTPDKSMVVLVDNDNRLASYVNDVPEVAYQLIEFSERPTTIVFSNAKNLAENVVAKDNSIGIRVVRHPLCEQLLARFRKPIVSTSANFTGDPSPRNFLEIDDDLKERVDYIVKYGQTDVEEHAPSIIIKIDPSGKFEFIRK